MKPAAILLLAAIARAQPADQPTPRTDANSRLGHEQLLAKAKQGRIDVYFAGDSITRRRSRAIRARRNESPDDGVAGVTTL